MTRLRTSFSLLLVTGCALADGQYHPPANAALRLELLTRVETDQAIRVRQYGWPGPQLVGRDGSEAAFLLVQHADHTFQKEMLPVVRNAYLNRKLLAHDYALLLDRVLVRDGKPQVYGTQFKIVGNDLVPDPIDDNANVDRRRADLGLPSLAEYLEAAKRTYSFAKKPDSRRR